MAVASDYPQMYTDLGIDTTDLGCIMLDTEPIAISDVVPEDALWYKPDEPESHTQGNVSETVPHVTLLYGLMSSGPALAKHVDTVLTDWQPEDLVIDSVGFFYNGTDQDNVTIIALLKVTESLQDGNGRLRLLPHIDTFPEYKPHITLAYVKYSSDWNAMVRELNKKYAGTPVKVVGINYGD